MAAPVRVVFLGGLGEIGRNCAAIEIGGRIMLIDCGLMFPDSDMAGVDLVLPDFTWLRENAHRVEGVVATHGHEDHIGALSFLLEEIPLQIIGSPLTIDSSTRLPPSSTVPSIGMRSPAGSSPVVSRSIATNSPPMAGVEGYCRRSPSQAGAARSAPRW